MILLAQSNLSCQKKIIRHLKQSNSNVHCVGPKSLIVALILLQVSSCSAFAPVHHYAVSSALFRSRPTIKSQPQSESPLRHSLSALSGVLRQRLNRRNGRTSSSALNMVLTTPAIVIEQASTQILLDDLIDESTRQSPRNSIMMQFDPSANWIWGRWKGTVFSETWPSCVRNMVYASFITLLYKTYETSLTKNLAGFNILWGQLLSVTTFTLTFFLNQSYALWRQCYALSRRLQGRMNDINLTMAAHAARVEIEGSKTDDGEGEENEQEQSSIYTEPARQVLELMARYTRVFNLLMYASFTASHRPVLTPQGMKRLTDRGILTERERLILSDSQLPVTQKHNALLLWMTRLFIDARKAGHIEGSDGFEQQFLDKVHVIRSQYGAVGDELQGRMPLAYAHIVQVLVDVILWMYPFMAFSTGMTPYLAVIGCGLLTMFYQGLFDLAKQFLDPYDNENYGKGDDPLCIDTLIAETNAGSIRFMNGLAQKPFLYKHVEDGEMLDYQLPTRGFTVDEARQREEEAMIIAAHRDILAAEKQAAQTAAEEVDLIPTPIPEPEPLEVEIDEDIEALLFGEEEDDDDVCDVDDENLTMAEALEKIEECTEKVP